MQDSTTKQAGNEGASAFGPDTIEVTMRARVRATIEAIVQEELDAALGAEKSARVGETRRHGRPDRRSVRDHRAIVGARTGRGDSARSCPGGPFGPNPPPSPPAPTPGSRPRRRA